jgi:hypothetical protein
MAKAAKAAVDLSVGAQVRLFQFSEHAEKL